MTLPDHHATELERVDGTDGELVPVAPVPQALPFDGRDTKPGAVQHPYSFDEARLAVVHIGRRQREAERFRNERVKAAAEAEKAYRRGLAVKIIELREQGWPATVCEHLARGDDEISDLKAAASILQGAVDTASHSLYRMGSDRKSLDSLVDWSKRVAPDGQGDEPEGRPAHIHGSGRRAA